jgi:hypothetical protein
MLVQFPIPSHIAADVNLLSAQDWGAPHTVSADLFAPSMQVTAPVVQEVTPTLQRWPGLSVHAMLAVQGTHAPVLSQTLSVPHDVPVAFCVLLLQTIVPVVQLVMPVKHGFGLPVQL